MSDITTFLRADRIACDRLFRRVENAVRRRSWPAAFGANARFERALNQHLLMEEQVLFKALEQYASDASKPIADILGASAAAPHRSHRHSGRTAMSCAVIFRYCHRASPDDAGALHERRKHCVADGRSFSSPGGTLSHRCNAGCGDAGE
jgi:hypothetical protein